jgi:hypothetical protein
MSQVLTLSINVNSDDATRSEQLTNALLRELRASDVVEQVVVESNLIPEGAKGSWGDWLKATFTPQNLQKLFTFIQERLPGQPIIEMELKIIETGNQTGKTLTLKASKPEDFIEAMQEAQKFIQTQG